MLLKTDLFSPTAYYSYSPLYLPATYTITYLLAFALSTCVLTHTALYHGNTLLNGFKRIRIERDDIHAKLMRNYPEVPDWWYGVAFGMFLAVAVIATEVWDTGVPVYALVLSVLLPVVYVLPSGFIYAMTGQGVFFFLPYPSRMRAQCLCSDYDQHLGANYPRNFTTRPAVCEHDFQSVFRTNAYSCHIFCARSQTRPLHQGSSTRYLLG